MAVLSTLALRPEAFSPLDLPDVYVAEGEKFVAFGPQASKLLLASLPSRRHIHPDERHFSAMPDFTTPHGPHEPFMMLDDLGEKDYTKDPVEFVLNDYEDADLDSLPGGGYRMRTTWKQRYVDLQQKVLDCCSKIIEEMPEEALREDGRALLQPLVDDTWIDLIRVYESYDEIADAIYSLKMGARNNLAALSYLMHAQHSWWRRALSAEDLTFVDRLELPRRPKRGCFINLLSDWSHLNIPLLLRADVPFAYVWSEAANAQPRFARLDPAVLTGYFWVRQNLDREPQPQEIPAVANGKEEATRFDHFLQDKRARAKGSPAARYEAGKTYLIQFHEGWKGKKEKDPEVIQRCLDRYEWYEKDPGDGASYVVIEAWSMRGAEDDSIRATYEFGPVATQSVRAEKLGGRVELSVDERREMYRTRYAPWGGSRYDAASGELLQAVALEKRTALIDLERLFYPRSPVLDHSVPPPSADQHQGDESSTPFLTRLSDPKASDANFSREATAASLIRRMGGFASEAASPPPTTHSSWRTETASDLPFSESAGRRRSASPRRGVRIPNAPAGLVAPDPSRISRDDAAYPGSPLWQQRLALLRSTFPSLLRSLSPRPYPRSDQDFFRAKWVFDFLRNGYLCFPREEDRLRVYLWLLTQEIKDASDLLRLCLWSGIRFEAGVLTDAKLPEAAREIVGPEPEHFEGEYLQFKDGGSELFSDYKRMVRDLCSLSEHATSFIYYGGFVSAVVAKFAGDILKDRVGTGVHLATRLYKSGQVRHPYGLSEEIVVERPSPRDINRLLGLVIGRDGKKLFWLFPPPDLLAAHWPGSGEWNEEEENYFLDIVSGLENGTRTALSKAKWTRQLLGIRNSLERDHADRRQPALSAGSARAWVNLLDWAYEVKDGSIKASRIGNDFQLRRLPLFR